MTKRKTAKLPTAASIYAFWHIRLYREYAKEWLNSNTFKHICFACGTHDTIERAHILPRCVGGNDTIGNIHLLCKECHIESEELSGAAYWIWLKMKSPANSGSLLRMNNLNQIYIQIQNAKNR